MTWIGLAFRARNVGHDMLLRQSNEEIRVDIVNDVKGM